MSADFQLKDAFALAGPRSIFWKNRQEQILCCGSWVCHLWPALDKAKLRCVYACRLPKHTKRLWSRWNFQNSYSSLTTSSVFLHYNFTRGWRDIVCWLFLSEPSIRVRIIRSVWSCWHCYCWCVFQSSREKNFQQGWCRRGSKCRQPVSMLKPIDMLLLKLRILLCVIHKLNIQLFKALFMHR